MAARLDLDSPPRVEEEEVDMEAEAEAIWRTVALTKAALERYDADRVGGRTAETTARHRATVRGTATSRGRRAWPPPFLVGACPKRAEDEELRPPTDCVVGEGGRIQEGEAAVAASGAQIGDEEDGPEASSFANGRVRLVA
ncbi:unnamed protein product [Urochloa humidicola]